jgi:surface antigen
MSLQTITGFGNYRSTASRGRRLTSAAISGLLAISGCASLDTTTPRLSGPAVAAGLINALGDGIIGADIGRTLGTKDRLKALEAEYRAFEYTAPGSSVGWTGSTAGQSGSATPGQPYQVGSQNCRQLVHVVSLASGETTRRGAACRNPDGSWTPLG